MFSKCANPEDGGGVKRIIMGLDRNTRCALLLCMSFAFKTHSSYPEHHVAFALSSSTPMAKRSPLYAMSPAQNSMNVSSVVTWTLATAKADNSDAGNPVDKCVTSTARTMIPDAVDGVRRPRGRRLRGGGRSRRGIRMLRREVRRRVVARIGPRRTFRRVWMRVRRRRGREVLMMRGTTRLLSR